MVRYSIYSGDPDGYFSIDPVSGDVRIASTLDHEVKPQVLLNVQATSGDPPAYGHTQVNHSATLTRLNAMHIVRPGGRCNACSVNEVPLC